ncbi:sulfite exporter TauE/SafE family protein [Nocardioides sp. GY 10127]|uniref:sulfite exporter TauE/SafE family protein n=1 Tax=Nocardioides sp. GY 10127 TaxID=2569762 RepID=UPI0010A8FAAE|nr:sulfite exporter TauE/SafE family protein [Nocardioides sp. GY 10127]TIC79983.1 sulfite exporter TauE/SafE family protein [Nocardioides sp. GY 10127]
MLQQVHDLGTLAVSLLVLAAFLVGFAKTGVSGVGTVSAALFALVLPARASSGAMLPLLIVGDLVAVGTYRRSGSWRVLARVLPAVLPGLAAGWVFIDHVDDTVMKATIGTIVVVLVLLALWQGRSDLTARVAGHPGFAVAAGFLAGFATMTANAAGPVMAIYLVAAGMPKLQMLGTTAWFYLVVNLLKVPLSVSLGLIHPASLLLDLALVPALLLGAWAGVRVAARMDQRTFELAALLLSLVAGVLLLVTL